MALVGEHLEFIAMEAVPAISGQMNEKDEERNQKNRSEVAPITIALCG
jgi:hypothetical protein